MGEKERKSRLSSSLRQTACVGGGRLAKVCSVTRLIASAQVVSCFANARSETILLDFTEGRQSIRKMLNSKYKGSKLLLGRPARAKGFEPYSTSVPGRQNRARLPIIDRRDLLDGPKSGESTDLF